MDDIPPPVTARNFLSTTVRPQTTTNVVRRTKSKSRTFLFPDEITTEPPKTIQRGVKFQDNNVLETTERTRRIQLRTRSTSSTSTTINPRRRNQRIRFQERSKEDPKVEIDQTASASEINVETYRDLTRYLILS